MRVKLLLIAVCLLGIVGVAWHYGNLREDSALLKPAQQAVAVAAQRAEIRDATETAYAKSTGAYSASVKAKLREVSQYEIPAKAAPEGCVDRPDPEFARVFNAAVDAANADAGPAPGL